MESPARAEPSRRSGNTHGFCVTGGLPPIASEPTPSPRLWTTSPGATPAKLCEHYHRVWKPDPKTGTFYFGGNRNFLLWSDMHSFVIDWILYVLNAERPGSGLNGAVRPHLISPASAASPEPQPAQSSSPPPLHRHHRDRPGSSDPRLFPPATALFQRARSARPYAAAVTPWPWLRPPKVAFRFTSAP
jgi:hypothetical protein